MKSLTQEDVDVAARLAELSPRYVNARLPSRTRLWEATDGQLYCFAHIIASRLSHPVGDVGEGVSDG